jgi:hypothetical protein
MVLESGDSWSVSKQNVVTRVGTFWRTMINDTFDGSHPAPSEARDQFMSYFGLWMRMFVDKGYEEVIEIWDELIDKEPPGSPYTWEKITPRAKEYNDWLEEQAANLEGKRLPENETRHVQVSWARNNPLHGQFRIDIDHAGTGRYFVAQVDALLGGVLGLGPETCMADDELWIIGGFPLPVVLRRCSLQEHERRFVGEAYVYGAMSGEVRNWGIELRDIILV